eukprot:CAMPEP_0204862958 /NCGR_PEP_ID=MMETSP1348-20121228/2955_1 /ASSEMBLY_ACC=CAM_ASM_000700 /TAXON_ID=215587 /ORGANISM="Aplanochytrium stocchinoi, Strain GSBS06" /LENGTH=424 /DNA_ID=CAMNT_0052013149 /DNA_START=6 /DNA_END=1280 /DNA_ORIENTATION=+
MADEIETVTLSEEDVQTAGKELLECSRYGELKELKEMLQSCLPEGEANFGAWHRIPASIINFKDLQGSTGAHRACANGHVDVLSFLLEIGAEHAQNDNGNTPLHWAVQNKQKEAIKILCEKVTDLDVLVQNRDGKSSLTYGFDAGDTDILKILLEHKSAEALQKKSQNEPDSEDAVSEKDEQVQTFLHEINFGTDKSILCREIGFNSGQLDEQDNLETTGAVIWAASLILSRWVIELKHIFADKLVVELGAGCGLPGLTACRFTDASRIVITDLMSKTFENLQYNVDKNLQRSSSKRPIDVHALDWCDEASWPSSICNGHTQILIGSDLVYSLDLVAPLINTILNLLDKKGGTFLYVTMDTSRAGFKEFCEGLQQAGLSMSKKIAPKEFLLNPLKSQDKVAFDLHFGEIHERTFHMYTFVRNEA